MPFECCREITYAKPSECVTRQMTPEERDKYTTETATPQETKKKPYNIEWFKKEEKMANNKERFTMESLASELAKGHTLEAIGKAYFPNKPGYINALAAKLEKHAAKMQEKPAKLEWEHKGTVIKHLTQEEKTQGYIEVAKSVINAEPQTETAREDTVEKVVAEPINREKLAHDWEIAQLMQRIDILAAEIMKLKKHRHQVGPYQYTEVPIEF